MCIAILNTKKAGSLPKSYIKNSWDNNDMGAGLLWCKAGKLQVYKTYKYAEFEEKYYSIREDRSVGNIILHFRIATSGYKGEHNLHPFLVSDELGFVHNGVISGLGNKQFSDTYEFNDMLKKFTHNFLSDEMTKYMISEFIGSSKLVFLNSKDEYSIINQEYGKWVDDNWFSNDSYKTYNSYYYFGNEKVSKLESDIDPYGNSFDDEVFEDICAHYSLDAYDFDNSLWLVEYYMELNKCESMFDLWEILYIEEEELDELKNEKLWED